MNPATLLQQIDVKLDLYLGLDIAHIGSVVVLLLYFSIIAFLFNVIFADHIRTYREKHGKSVLTSLRIFGFLAAASFIHTWYYMFKFLAWSFVDYEKQHVEPGAVLPRIHVRLANWLHDTSLFLQAWEIACSTSSGWWWSQQICLYTVGGWLSFLTLEGSRQRIKHLACYMLLGQLVAISVASNLFYIALILASATSTSPAPKFSVPSLRITKRLWIPTVIGLLTVLISPWTSGTRLFGVNLGIMHLTLFVPLVFPLPKSSTSLPQSSFSWPYYTWALFLAITTILVRTTAFWSDVLHLWVGWSKTNVATLMYSNPASSSIGWDVEWTALSYVVWKYMQEKGKIDLNSAGPLAMAKKANEANSDSSLWLRKIVFDSQIFGVGTMCYDLLYNEELDATQPSTEEDDKEKVSKISPKRKDKIRY